jgi:GH35 family endo-1,4-beta-xylanase
MMRVWLSVLAAVVSAACDQGTTSRTEPVWDGSIGRLVLESGGPAAFDFVRLDGAGPEHGRMGAIAAEAIASGSAARLETLGQPPRMESLQARLATIGDIDDGDACWLRFEARAAQPQVELGLGRTLVMVRPTDEDLEPWLRRSIYLNPGWTSIDMVFVAPDDGDAGEAEFVLAVGTQLQTLDVADVSMRCFNEDEDMLARLPSTPFSYGGREVDADWRVTAESQIERYRQGDLTVNVTDTSGQPVADAEIHIQMTRHAFTFGALIDAGQLAGIADENDEAITASYRRNLKELFNTVSFYEGLRWTFWSEPEARKATEQALEWVRSLGLALRGHGLVSTASADLPEALQEQQGDPGLIREAVRRGVEATAGELDGSIKAWDVVERPRDNHDLLDLIGSDELLTWFRLVRSAAPSSKLVLSESEILSGDRMAELATLVGTMISENVPVDRIGVLGQFGTQPPPIQVLSDRLDQLASFDLPLVITAFDMATPDKALQQDFTRDFLTLAFSHPSVEGFMVSRFWEGKDDPLGVGDPLYRSDGTISPLGKIYRDLVLDRWWTDIMARSDEKGELKDRVFQGDYVVSARKGELSATTMLKIGPEGADITLSLAFEQEKAGERAL